jgi:hypothetical protein
MSFELKPVVAIGRPSADGVDELSRRYRGGVPNDRDEVALTARLHLQDGEAIFLIESWLRLSEQRPAKVKWISAGLC